ncbi:MAG: Holliday junction resolvase RuvX [Phycisphaerae bacterium]
MGRWIGIDYGSRRIGLALGDFNHRIASPAHVLPARRPHPSNAAEIVRWADPHEPCGFVVGMPFNMDGTSGPQADFTQAFVRALRRATRLPVETWDERLTSFQADENLATAGVSTRRGGALRDAFAAQVMLQAFLDARRADESSSLSEPRDV